MVNVKVNQLSELSSQEFFEIARERVKVFVVEQTCYYQEIDDGDATAYHLRLFDDQGYLVGYTRMMDEGTYATFGRVLVPKAERGHGYGRRLVQVTIEQTKQLFPGKLIAIEAQNYLRDFYASFGFKAVSDVFVLDGIPHVKMQLDGEGKNGDGN